MSTTIFLILLLTLLFMTACTTTGQLSPITDLNDSAEETNTALIPDTETETSCAETYSESSESEDEEVGELTVTNGITTFVPYTNDDVLLNPDMGWVFLDVADKKFQDMGSTGDYPLIQNVCITTGWSHLEPIKDHYNWSVLDETIDYWIGKGKRIQFRITTDCYPYYGATFSLPSWLLAKGVPYQTHKDWTNQTVVNPDITNSVYREELVEFLSAFADKYRSLEELDCVDLLGYGEWGEWHSGWRFDDWDTRVDALKWILDTWVNAWNGDKRLYLNYPCEVEYGYLLDGTHPQTYEEYLNFSAYDYAVDKFSNDVLGFRREGVAGMILDCEVKFCNELYKSNRIQISEFCNGLKFYQNSGKPMRSFIDEALALHPNYIIIMGWDKKGHADEFYRDEIDNIEYALKKMGYRMELTKASYPSVISAGNDLIVNTEWKNTACGVLPDGYTLQVAAYDANGDRVACNTSNSFSPAAFSQNENSEAVSITAISTDTLSRGKYTLACAILNTNHDPILLPVQGKQDDGFYYIGTFTVE